MSDQQFIRILIAPLDWGLGHATRCIPIIKFFLRCNCTIIIASEGQSYHLLRAEFPTLQFLHLRGYRVRYANDKRFLLLKILFQVPKVLQTIIKEHRWLQSAINEHSIDAVISDNRFGFWSRLKPSIFITHQLQIKGPNKWIEWVLRKANYQHINKYKMCWVPDFKDEPNLAGLLSHPGKFPSIPFTYLGPLSRFTKEENITIIYDVLFLLSGPEPQRSILEAIIYRQLKLYAGRALIVRGKPGEADKPKDFNQVTVINHLPGRELGEAIQASNFIVSRAGYTTIMDMIKLEKKCIFIPTPGQTEQEYLANHLHQQNISIAIEQQNFNLGQALQAASIFPYQLPTYNMDGYQQVILQWLHQLTNEKQNQTNVSPSLQGVS